MARVFNIVWFLTASIFAIAGLPPRLWEVTGQLSGGEKGHFFVLAVTHNGLPAEYDDYFEKAVLPIFNKSDFFVDESAIFTSQSVPPCLTPLPKSKEAMETLKAGRDRVQAAMELMMTYQLPPNMSPIVNDTSRASARSYVGQLSEYGLITAMKEFLQATNKARPFLPESKPMVADYMKHSRPYIRTESIDTPKEFITAYCGVGVSRIRYFQKEINNFDPAKYQSMPKDQADWFVTEYYDSLKNGKISKSLIKGFPGSGPSDFSVDYHKSFVCERNRNWIRYMEKNLGHETGFYALGFAHLLPLDLNNPPCNDLLTDLKARGFTVDLVRQAN